jgi:hypothetical protein
MGDLSLRSIFAPPVAMIWIINRAHVKKHYTALRGGTPSSRGKSEIDIISMIAYSEGFCESDRGGFVAYVI